MRQYTASSSVERALGTAGGRRAGVAMLCHAHAHAHAILHHTMPAHRLAMTACLYLHLCIQ